MAMASVRSRTDAIGAGVHTALMRTSVAWHGVRLPTKEMQMSKGQKGNKEAKKPKQKKGPAAPIVPAEVPVRRPGQGGGARA
jgi:hypothetical protein